MIGCSLLGLCSSILYWFCGGSVNNSVLDSEFLFSDYYYHFAASSVGGNIWENVSHVIFPPLAYCFYWLLWRINPYLGDPEDWNAFKYAPNSLLIYVMYNVFIALLLFYCVQKILYAENNLARGFLLSALILFSYPFFATGIQRGNAAVLIGVLLCLVFIWKDSPNKFLREMALVLIAVAAGFKIYPAFLGVIYLAEKRYKEAFRLVLYGILAFFGPFIFWGGIEGFLSYLSKLFIKGSRAAERWGTIRGLCNMFLSGWMGEQSSNMLGLVLQNIYLFISLIAIWKTKTNWKRIFYACAVLVLYVSGNWMYTLTYMLPAFLFWLKERGEENVRSARWKDVGEAIAWGIIYSLPTWYFVIFHKDMYGCVYLMLYLLLFLNLGEEIIILLRNRKWVKQL